MKDPSAVPASLHKLIREVKSVTRTTPWSRVENTKFEQGVSKFGRDWVKIASTIKSKTHQ